MLEINLIKPNNSPRTSPMILVPKKDGSFRLVVDYRWLKTTSPSVHFSPTRDTWNSIKSPLDYAIHSTLISEHERKLLQVFKRLADVNLTIIPSKCQFFCLKIDFLGHTLTSSSILPNASRLHAMTDFP